MKTSGWQENNRFHTSIITRIIFLIYCSCPLERLSKKFKRLAKHLQSWGHKEVGNVKNQLGLAQEVMHRLETAHDNRILSGDELWLLGKLKKHCFVNASMERIIARLRSRIKYLKGEVNTKFFHMQA